MLFVARAVPGAGGVSLLAGLATDVRHQVPATGGLPGQPAPRHHHPHGAPGHPLR